MLIQNPPIDRLNFIVKTYGEKQPWVVLDTLSVIFPTIGIDEPLFDIQHELQTQQVEGDLSRERFRTLLGDAQALFRWTEMARGLPQPDPLQSPDSYSSLIDAYWDSTGEDDFRLRRRMAGILWIVSLPGFSSGRMSAPHEADGIFPWVAREFSKLSKFTIRETDRTGDASTYRVYTESLDLLRRSGNAIAQWAKLNRVDLMKKSLAEVAEAIKTFRYSSKVRQGVVVHKFKSGWTVQELQTKRELDDEHKALDHCVDTYCERVKLGKSVIYSLRDPDGVPYITMEWKPAEASGKGKFTQVFGKTNSEIGEGVFNEYVLAAGQDNDPPLQPSQVSEVVIAIRAMVIEFIDQKHGGDVSGLLLAGGSLSGRDLTGAFLRGKDLYGMDLVGAKLANANLGYVNLSSADLSDADLSGADLEGAHFDYTKLIGANLKGAHFGEADLVGADLSRADLRGVDLSRATLFIWFQKGLWDPSPPRKISAILSGAKYDSETFWPEDFDPVAAGAVKVD